MQKPNKKVQAGGMAGALTTLIVGGARMGGVEVPAEVAAAATTLVFGLVAYFVPESKSTP